VLFRSSLDRGQLPVKVWYSGQFFRAERPQAGRYRQFYQVGIEAIGIDDPALDAEVIAIADQGFKNLGLKNYRLEITSLGDTDSRAAHKTDLMKFIATLDLDEATRTRAELNPLRLFDDKRPEMIALMAQAPLLLNYLTDYSRNHFEKVKGYLDALGISYVVNPRMVRGLDYYTGTTFEFVHQDLGAQSGIGGGGRYDGLMEVLGGQPLSGIGFGLGVDRALLAAIAEGSLPISDFSSDLFIIPLGEESKTFSLTLAAAVRSAGFAVEVAFGERSLKGSMKGADKSGARYVLVIGENEIESSSFELKRMSDGVLVSVKMSELNTVLGA
jgi:histidyl-tRNA synthetase